jgi:hypothetical protein
MSKLEDGLACVQDAIEHNNKLLDRYEEDVTDEGTMHYTNAITNKVYFAEKLIELQMQVDMHLIDNENS